MFMRRKPENIFFLLVTMSLLITLAASRPARAQEGETPAATITVNSHLDTSGNGSICTLRDAILAANNNTAVGGCAAGSPYPAMDSINIQFSTQFCKINGCTIILSAPLPAVSEDVSIQGTGNWVPTIATPPISD